MADVGAGVECRPVGRHWTSVCVVDWQHREPQPRWKHPARTCSGIVAEMRCPRIRQKDLGRTWVKSNDEQEYVVVVVVVAMTMTVVAVMTGRQCWNLMTAVAVVVDLCLSQKIEPNPRQVSLMPMTTMRRRLVVVA